MFWPYVLQGKLKKFTAEKEKSLRELSNQIEKKDQQRIIAEKNLAALQTKVHMYSYNL